MNSNSQLKIMYFSFVKKKSSPKMLLVCQNWLKLSQWVWRRNVLSFIIIVFLLFRYFFPLGKGVALPLNETESPSPKYVLQQVGWKWPCGTGGDFKISSIYFRHFIIISPGNMHDPSFELNLNFLSPRMFCAKSG